MRVSTRAHGIMDLLYGASFLAAPFILKALSSDNDSSRRGRRGGRGHNSNRSSDNNGNGSNLENILLPSIGAGILAQGMLTDFELGAVKAMSMPAHLTTDLGMGAAMIAAPYVLNLDRRLRVPMTMLGAAQIGLALMTKTRPAYDNLANEIDTYADEIAEAIA